MLSAEEQAYLRAHSNEAYDLLLTLAQIPAPSNHEEQRRDFCVRWLKGIGAEGVYTDSALNVVYPIGVEEDKPVVIFMAHMDVVFPDTEPLPLKEANGRVYCPGVGDDTANVAALLLAAKYVTQKALFPRDCGVLFVCNTGEEGMGNLKGSRKICEDYQGRIKAVFSFDGTMAGVVNRAVGSHRFRVTVRTQGGHSYQNFGRTNAIAVLAKLIADIYELKVPLRGKTTYNVGTIEGGTSVNSIAQEASMLCEYRSDEEDSLARMEGAFAQLFARYNQPEAGIHVQVERVGVRPCESLSPEEAAERGKLVEDAAALLTRLTGRSPRLGPSSTDCNIPLSEGIPSVCFGACFGEGAHTREEYVERASLALGYEAVLETVLQYFKGSGQTV